MRTATMKMTTRFLLLVAVTGGLMSAQAQAQTQSQDQTLAATHQTSRANGFIWESVLAGTQTSAGTR